jgi:tripartite-type tricarboxylate transporter receptor subunit TctC
MPAADVNELIVWLKANPDKASAAVVSAGTRLSTMFFQRETGTQFTLVPYRSTGLAMQDMVAGRIDLLFSTPDQLPQMRAGGIKAYAVTSETRLAVAPDIPTFSEMGLPALSFYTWFGLFAPKGTPREVIGKFTTCRFRIRNFLARATNAGSSRRPARNGGQSSRSSVSEQNAAGCIGEVRPSFAAIRKIMTNEI